MNKIKHLWTEHRLLLLGFTAATLITLFFLFRFVFFVVYFANNRDATIEPWMPIGYIARSYHVERDWLAAQTGLPEPEILRRISIEDAANEAGISFNEMRARLLAAIEDARTK